MNMTSCELTSLSGLFYDFDQVQQVDITSWHNLTPTMLCRIIDDIKRLSKVKQRQQDDTNIVLGVNEV